MRGAPRVGVGGERVRGANGRDTLTINRPTPIMPPRAVSDRPTGAAARTPGVSLEGELRRTRVFNNREPRMPSAPDANVGNSPSPGSINRDSGTGAVERPRAYGRPNTNPGGDSAQPARVRPTRPNVPVEPSPSYPTGDDAVSPKRRERDTGGGGGDSGEPRVRPRRPSSDQPTDQPPTEAPRDARPPDDSSSPVNHPRHEPRTRPRDDEGTPPSAPTRREEPSPRREEPEPRHESPRSEPRHEQPRQEPRQEAPRSEPPRQEAPRQEAPRHEAPRQEAPRQETPRQRDPDAPRPRERPDNR
jgi:hypothetical protein